MNQLEAKGIVAVKELPKILRDFAKAAKLNRLSTTEEFNVFATRYFAKLAGYHVEGFPDLDETDRHTIHIYREVKDDIMAAMTPEPGAAVGLGEAVPLLQLSINPNWTEIEHKVYGEICALRANPPAYATKLEQLHRYFDEVTQSLAVPGGVIFSTHEGWAAYQECIDQLRDTPPMPAFWYSLALTLAAMAGMAETEASTQPRHLAEKFGMFDEELGSCVAQSICVNQVLPQSIVIHLLVDDGYPTRGNRTNLLSEGCQHIGICFQDVTCSMIFASNYRPIGKLPNVPFPEIPEAFDYDFQLNHDSFAVLSPKELAAIVKQDMISHPPPASDASQRVHIEVDEVQLELVLLDPCQEAVTVDKNHQTFVLSYSSGHLTAALTVADDNQSNSVVGKGCLCQCKNGVAVIQTHFPGPGEYRLSISADTTGDGMYFQVFEYQITALGGCEAPKEFPATFLQSHVCYLYCPHTANLRKFTQLVPFVVEATGPCKAIAVLSGEELIHLKADDVNTHMYGGKMRLQQGPLKVSANIDGTHYEVFSFHVH